jgi:hypothetical protein
VGDKIAIRETEGLSDRLAGLSGSFAVTARIKGEAALPRADIDLVGTGLSWQSEQLGDARAYVRLTDKSDPWVAQASDWQGGPPAGADCGHARLGFARGQWPEDPPLRTAEGPLPALDQPMAWVICGQAMQGQIAVDMAVGRTQVMPLRGRVLFHDLTLAKLLPRRPGQAPLRGRLGGHVQFDDGALHEPATLSGRVLLDTLRAGQLDVELMNSGPVDVSFRRGDFEVTRAEFIGPSSQLYIRGSGRLRSGANRPSAMSRSFRRSSASRSAPRPARRAMSTTNCSRPRGAQTVARPRTWTLAPSRRMRRARSALRR